tara:strand:+ start:480 stop:716 length:237 start_codon:yes stop_codon:yes gene_type:complete
MTELDRRLDEYKFEQKANKKTIVDHGGLASNKTLRDEFAGQAMSGLYSDPELEMSDYDIATFSYDMADAMLEARKVTK